MVVFMWGKTKMRCRFCNKKLYQHTIFRIYVRTLVGRESSPRDSGATSSTGLYLRTYIRTNTRIAPKEIPNKTKGQVWWREQDRRSKKKKKRRLAIFEQEIWRRQ